jgi:hypothetical protein
MAASTYCFSGHTVDEPRQWGRLTQPCSPSIQRWQPTCPGAAVIVDHHLAVYRKGKEEIGVQMENLESHCC